MRFPAVVLAPWPQPNVMFSMVGEYLVDAVGNVRENSHKMGVWQVFSEWQHLVSIACDYRSRARVSRVSGREPGVNPIRHWGDRDCGNFAAWLGVAFSASRCRRWLVRPISIQSTPCRGFLPSFQVPTAFAVCDRASRRGGLNELGAIGFCFRPESRGKHQTHELTGLEDTQSCGRIPPSMDARHSQYDTYNDAGRKLTAW